MGTTEKAEKVHDKTGRGEPSFNYGPVIVAVSVCVLTLVFFLLWKRRRSARRDILLTGLSDSGKTLIFSQLIHSQHKQTHTSVVPNIEEFHNNNIVLRVVDVPGHERLRGKYFDEFKSLARGIVFIIDSVTFNKDIRDVADFLYTILSDITVSSHSTPILILCNKQDQTMAKGSGVVKMLLEKEINVVRTTRTSQLQSVDSFAPTAVFLGKQGREFEFSHLSQYIEIAESTAIGTGQLEHLNNWISKLT